MQNMLYQFSRHRQRKFFGLAKGSTITTYQLITGYYHYYGVVVIQVNEVCWDQQACSSQAATPTYRHFFCPLIYGVLCRGVCGRLVLGILCLLLITGIGELGLLGSGICLALHCAKYHYSVGGISTIEEGFTRKFCGLKVRST